MLTRRNVLKAAAAGAVASAVGLPARSQTPADARKIKFSVTGGFGRSMPMDEFLSAVKSLGIEAIDLVKPDDWKTVQDHGLAVSLGSGPGMGIKNGFNRPEYHDALVADYEKMIPIAADAGVTSLICFSGNRNGMDDQTGLDNSAEGLKRLMPLCEQKGVTLVMELLNSKVNHPGYMADHTAWGAELCKKVGSDRFKLLHDIYHMQIMEGDLIRTIRDNIDVIAHFHVAGNPGRHDPDDTQEIYYPAVMRAIVETGYDGYVAFEYSPAKKNPTTAERLESLKNAIAVCNV
ncbi:hydroxypyruvate isomerase family protein [Novipirellula artificiosorum]|uniref:Hydroxypyruvate isomerase n=1 Tax=Novipirellula artificiosorum TaxID=2528016 RepID=A0A5C6DW40_9BACT|nr:TIM barrel protein [Novipirellula artificiosorum]TWU40812.1 Hydroxypyruvate isomerase [Novipirellula artificiosorum]